MYEWRGDQSECVPVGSFFERSKNGKSTERVVRLFEKHVMIRGVWIAMPLLLCA
jgi:hypothetical protein